MREFTVQTADTDLIFSEVTGSGFSWSITMMAVPTYTLARIAIIHRKPALLIWLRMSTTSFV
jgi:hypothetical protein